MLRFLKSKLNPLIVRCFIFLLSGCSGMFIENVIQNTPGYLTCETHLFFWDDHTTSCTGERGLPVFVGGKVLQSTSDCPYETRSLITPFFSLLLRLTMGYCCQATAQAWKTSCLGHCSPLPTLSYKGVLTTLGLLFGPQNIHQPPIWLFAEKKREPSWGEQSRRAWWEEEGVCGWAPVGSMVSVWTLIKTES